MATPRPPPLVATCRLQLHAGFTLDDAAAQVPYLAALGVSHVYLSPCLQAMPGSTHGYDVVDPSRVNAELGGEAARQRLCRALEAAGMGQVLDLVPNHMAVAGERNPWWWDVLENGPSSRYAPYFDVDWEACEERWPNKVLLPVLEDHYGRVLEGGALRLRLEAGRFTLHCRDETFPLDPSSLADLLDPEHGACDHPLLDFLAEACRRLPRPRVTLGALRERRHRDKDVIRDLLARLCREVPAVEAALQARVAALNRDPDALDALLEQQNYRLAWWRTADRDLGYRRFFDIQDLAGLRVEDEAVFLATHALPIRWCREGCVQGLRIDHPDGLRDPAQYLRRLSRACPGTWRVVEKILMPGEALPRDWPVDGTTGYDFLNRVQGLFVDPAGEGPLTALWGRIRGEPEDWPACAEAGRRQVLEERLASELGRLSALFVRVCERHRRHRDYTRHQLRRVLLETACAFPVYRTYVTPSAPVAPSDIRVIATALDTVRQRCPDLDAELLDFFQALLTRRLTGDLETELTLRFQQLTGPAMAKGVEDTAFYRFHRLVALNEVGGDPGAFGTDPQDFHAACEAMRQRHPRTLLATSTHDTKRSEDVRARLVLLSEIPGAWGEAVAGFMEGNARHRQGAWPDAPTEYLYYQTLVGVWPDPDADPADLGPRLRSYMEKAVREAGVHTCWIRPDEAYEAAVQAFVTATLEDADFCRSLEAFVAPLRTPGRVNGLAQTLIKLTAPGIPDLYQGTDLFDLSLVDPDNRRPVDWDLRRRLMAVLDGDPSPEAVLAHGQPGLAKLWLIRRTLALRHARPRAFAPEAAHRPCRVRGRCAGHALAYLRGGEVLVLVPRLVLGLGGQWRDTVLNLPPGRWDNPLTGEVLEGGRHDVAALLARFPVALLARRERPS
ncbi:malto-oligosyltrehalose synthase [Ectothiorhodospira mobilis]|uniref:malto-oligosyltrehalose synthase n=1 Tax=Ectothiorhodospira mobilis TaxID=195064 RepID=UPI0019081C92|nr:malto-oligosyltrehalose synthase [Ectothiorhodospira mobilis]MBK1691753.1 malto-oligosyltrehalose synthase [Ectothiorhodospira mobilis]